MIKTQEGSSCVVEPKNGRSIRQPTFWPLTPETTAIQVHSTDDANRVKRELEGKRIAYACRGERLEVFRVSRSVEVSDRWVTEVLPNANRVWGGENDK